MRLPHRSPLEGRPSGREDEQRLHALSAWRDTPSFSDRERAALALTEVVTCIADGHPPQHLIDDASSSFTPSELTCVLCTAIEINAWNRSAITVGRPKPGSYQRPSAAPD